MAEQTKQRKSTGREAIRCEATSKLLALLDNDYLYLWCSVCHQSHRYTWSEIGKLLLPREEGNKV